MVSITFNYFFSLLTAFGNVLTALKSSFAEEVISLRIILTYGFNFNMNNLCLKSENSSYQSSNR